MGYCSLKFGYCFGRLLLGPWLVFCEYGTIKKSDSEKKITFHVDAIVIGLVVICFMIDSLINGMTSPVYILCSGALISYHIATKHNSMGGGKL